MTNCNKSKKFPTTKKKMIEYEHEYNNKTKKHGLNFNAKKCSIFIFSNLYWIKK